MPDARVYVRHLRSAKLCMGGSRVWFADRGWSWTEFLIEGRPVADFIATGDPLALRAAAEAQKEEMTDGR